MLSPEELKKIAHFKSLPLTYAEKDYLHDAILFALYSRISDELIFKGGVCQFKYLRVNRFSEDLDFALNKSINVKNVFESIISEIGYIGIKASIKKITENNEGIHIDLRIKGPLYKESKKQFCHININIYTKDKILLPFQRDRYAPFYNEFNRYDMFIIDTNEILAEKICLILTRGKPWDVYDAWVLLVHINAKFDKSLIEKKLSRNKKEFSINQFSKIIEKQRANWKKDLKSLVIGTMIPDFNMVKKELLEKLK